MEYFERNTFSNLNFSKISLHENAGLRELSDKFHLE